MPTNDTRHSQVGTERKCCTDAQEEVRLAHQRDGLNSIDPGRDQFNIGERNEFLADDGNAQRAEDEGDVKARQVAMAQKAGERDQGDQQKHAPNDVGQKIIDAHALTIVIARPEVNRAAHSASAGRLYQRSLPLAIGKNPTSGLFHSRHGERSEAISLQR